MSQSIYWCFRYSNPVTDNFQNIPCTYMVFQLELSSLTSHLHYQGYVVLKKKKRMSTLKNLFAKYGAEGVHLENRLGTHKEAKHYCMKPVPNCSCKHCIENPITLDGPYQIGDDSRVPDQEDQGKRSDLLCIQDMIKEGRTYDEIEDRYFVQCARYHKFVKQKINERDNRIFEELERSDINSKLLYNWQNQGLWSFENLSPKEILWIYGILGQEGKSHFADYLYLNFKGYLATNKKSENITYLYERENVIIFNYTRENDKKISYQLIEEFSDGRITSTKYEPAKKYVRNPKVVVLANWPPESDKLTKKRLKVCSIEEFTEETGGYLKREFQEKRRIIEEVPDFKFEYYFEYQEFQKSNFEKYKDYINNNNEEVEEEEEFKFVNQDLLTKIHNIICEDKNRSDDDSDTSMSLIDLYCNE